jgi:hypothetical protein
MTRSRHCGRTCRLFSAGWWVRVLALVLFAGSVNYERAHLSLDAHLDAVPLAGGDPPPEDAFEATSQEEDHHHHDAHPAWEHTMHLARVSHAVPIGVRECYDRRLHGALAAAAILQTFLNRAVEPARYSSP